MKGNNPFERHCCEKLWVTSELWLCVSLPPREKRVNGAAIDSYLHTHTEGFQDWQGTDFVERNQLVSRMQIEEWKRTPGTEGWKGANAQLGCLTEEPPSSPDRAVPSQLSASPLPSIWQEPQTAGTTPVSWSR